MPFLAEGAQLIKSVSISKEFFNPSLGQTVQISLALLRSGLLSVTIIDRDGYSVSTLSAEKSVKAGNLSFVWDGKNKDGSVVPDEAYSVLIQLKTGDQLESYFPANKSLPEEKAELAYYDRKRAVISYRLPKPSRIHLQTGVAVVDPASKKVEGPVMATVVNQEPRASGWIAEHWNGFADSDSRIYVPDLLNFKLAIAATALPENSIIVVGNRKQIFIEYAAMRKGKSLLTHTDMDHHHHQGLSSHEDVSPSLTLRPQNASWSEKDQIWLAESDKLKILGHLGGQSAQTFSKQPGYLVIFVDGKEIQKISHPCSQDFEFEIPKVHLNSGPQIISANCASEYGTNSSVFLASCKEFRYEDFSEGAT